MRYKQAETLLKLGYNICRQEPRSCKSIYWKSGNLLMFETSRVVDCYGNGADVTIEFMIRAARNLGDKLSPAQR